MDLSWTKDIVVQFSAQGFKTLTFTGTYANGSVTFDTTESGSVYAMLSAGPATLTLTINTNTIDLCTAETLAKTKEIQGTVDFCVGASGQISKTLSNLTN
jgi:hypothetical protein